MGLKLLVLVLAGMSMVSAQTQESSSSESKYPLRQALAEFNRVGAAMNAAADKRSAAAPLEGALADAREVPLPRTAQDAVELAVKILGERNRPVPSADGKIQFIYGVGLPTIVCAPLRICVLELQPGEELSGQPLIGDPVRWHVLPASAGRGDNAVQMIAIKPILPGEDTTMLLATTRRVYYVRLVSHTEAYMPRASFVYPDDDELKWTAELKKQEQARQEKQREETSRASAVTPGGVDRLNFRYRIRGNGPETMRPVRVFDDGQKTYIQMPASAEHMELPALVVVVGKVEELVNFRVQGGRYVVDRLFDRGALLMGTGKQQRLFWIEREGKEESEGKSSDAE
jgi:type IV secretion system protein VirB9